MVEPQPQPRRNCIVCGQEMLPHLDAAIMRCPACLHYSSNFGANSDGFLASLPAAADSLSTLDESQRQLALRELRIRQARATLAIVAAHIYKRSPRLCDIGCGYGWFMEVAREFGFEVSGIEPDERVALAAMQRGLTVQRGWFPDCLLPEDRFDVLAFNDVWEHLEDAAHMAAACRQHLAPHGLLVIVAPSSRGAFFRLASTLACLGSRRAWDRMWQKSFSSPHRHYYAPAGLTRVLSSEGFEPVYAGNLPSVQSDGLWQRLRMDRTASWPGCALIWSTLMLLLPALRWLPQDIMLQVYKRGSTVAPNRSSAAHPHET
jgi:SAM-dependent methyltransferase